MDTLSVAAASGMKARLETLDLLANNIANAGTAGFKADREFYDLYASAEAMSAEYPASTLPVVERNWIDFAQGPLQSTGNEFDLAIEGKGFFVVESNNGTLLTRKGDFRVARDGTLQSAEGYPVRKAGGGMLKVDPNRQVSVGRDGTVSQDGTAIGRIDVASPEKPEELMKLGNTYFRMSDVAGILRSADGAVWQGRLEGTNFGPAENAVRLVHVMRQFEMLQRAAALGGDMTRKAVEEVARVSA